MTPQIPVNPTVEEAITTAISFETKVRDTYLEAVKSASDETGKRVFQLLADEEQGHLDYLNSRLDEWNSSGKITAAKLETAIPPSEMLEKRAAELKKELSGKDRGEEIAMLQKAEEVEKLTSEFYAAMVESLSDEAQQMFERFVEIEEGHLAIVRAEIDALSGSGYFFDMPEFNLEA